MGVVLMDLTYVRCVVHRRSLRDRHADREATSTLYCADIRSHDGDSVNFTDISGMHIDDPIVQLLVKHTHTHTHARAIGVQSIVSSTIHQTQT